MQRQAPVTPQQVSAFIDSVRNQDVDQFGAMMSMLPLLAVCDILTQINESNEEQISNLLRELGYRSDFLGDLKFNYSNLNDPEIGKEALIGLYIVALMFTPVDQVNRRISYITEAYNTLESLHGAETAQEAIPLLESAYGGGIRELAPLNLETTEWFAQNLIALGNDSLENKDFVLDKLSNLPTTEWLRLYKMVKTIIGKDAANIAFAKLLDHFQHGHKLGKFLELADVYPLVATTPVKPRYTYYAGLVAFNRFMTSTEHNYAISMVNDLGRVMMSVYGPESIL